MPVHRSGKKIVEDSTGKVVGHSKSVKKAKAAARIRNMAHAAKRGDKDAQRGMERLRESENPHNQHKY